MGPVELFEDEGLTAGRPAFHHSAPLKASVAITRSLSTQGPWAAEWHEGVGEVPSCHLGQRRWRGSVFVEAACRNVLEVSRHQCQVVLPGIDQSPPLP